jgi:hypothetical protein
MRIMINNSQQNLNRIRTQKSNEIMKNLPKLIFLPLILFASLTASAQIYITIRPAAPVIVQTERPGPAYIWISEEWVPDGATYRYVGGYWGKPPSAGYKWKKGYWGHSRGRGHHWVSGSWHGKKGKK